MSKIVRYEVDLNHFPPLTKKQKQEIARLKAMKDETIDKSDIPELDDDFWKNAQHSHFYKPKKQSTTVRLDRDVLVWLKKQGKGYQTRLNAILRGAMLAEQDK